MVTAQRDSLYNTGGPTGQVMLQKAIGLQPRTLSDWLATTSGNQRTAQYGYFGPGHLLRKDITSAGDATIASDFFTNTFGAKVWDSLNSQTRFFNLIRKVAWGNTTGWRIRSGRNTSTRGVAETAALPTIDTPDLQSVHVQPSFVVTAMGVSALAQFLATLEGGLGDALAVAQEAAEVDHLKKLNQMLLAPSMHRVATPGASGTAALGADFADYVSAGDTFWRTDHKADANYITIGNTDGEVGSTTLNYQTTGNNAALTGNPVLFARSRAGLPSLSDIVEHDGRTVYGVDLGDGFGATYGSLRTIQTGRLNNNRVAGNWNAAATVNDNNGTLRHLTTGYLDRAIERIRINGFQPDLIVTGVEQEVRLGTILQANQHFIGEGNFQVKQGGEATLPGYETGFEVATYKKIPLFTDPDAPPTWSTGTGAPRRGTDVFVLDTRYLEVPVLFTTQYIESRDYIHNNLLGIKAIFLTAASLRALNFRAQAKVTDLSDGVNIS